MGEEPERQGVRGLVHIICRMGCPCDNSCVKVFATLKKRCIYRVEYDTIEIIKRDLFKYIELFYSGNICMQLSAVLDRSSIVFKLKTEILSIYEAKIWILYTLFII